MGGLRAGPQAIFGTQGLDDLGIQLIEVVMLQLLAPIAEAADRRAMIRTELEAGMCRRAVCQVPGEADVTTEAAVHPIGSYLADG